MIKCIDGSNNNNSHNEHNNHRNYQNHQYKKDKISHISTIDALLDDYSRNKSTYTQLFSENDKESISHQFLEGLYIKYSKNLENYMKQNKRGMKLSGTRRYDNVAVDLFLKESKSYKTAIISELHNKYKSKFSLRSIEDIFLTPLPDKPRVLLTTQQQKDEFQAAERLAVVIRTVEYTNALKYLGNQYSSMKNDERQGMIYNMRRATLTIQNWWNGKGKKGMLKWRKVRGDERSKKNMIALKNLFNKINRRLLRDKARLLNRLKEISMNKDMTINKIRLTLLAEKKHLVKKLIRKWEYYTKTNISYSFYKNQHRIIHQNCNSLSKQFTQMIKGKIKDKTQKEKLIFLQQYIKGYLKHKIKKTLQHRHLFLLLKYKDIIHSNMLLKSILQWIRIIRYETSNKYIINNHSSINVSSLPQWYTYLPKVIDNHTKKRNIHVFDLLKQIQQKQKGISNISNIFRNHQLSNGLNPIKKDIVINLLKKIIIKRHKKNCLWKYYQLWNIKILILHIFIKKINKHTVLKAYKLLFRKIMKKSKKIPKEGFGHSMEYMNFNWNSIDSLMIGVKGLRHVIVKCCFRKIRQLRKDNNVINKQPLFYLSSNVDLDESDNNNRDHYNNNRKLSISNNSSHPRINPISSLNNHEEKALYLRDLQILDEAHKFI